VVKAGIASFRDEHYWRQVEREKGRFDFPHMLMHFAPKHTTGCDHPTFESSLSTRQDPAPRARAYVPRPVRTPPKRITGLPEPPAHVRGSGRPVFSDDAGHPARGAPRAPPGRPAARRHRWSGTRDPSAPRAAARRERLPRPRAPARMRQGEPTPRRTSRPAPCARRPPSGWPLSPGDPPARTPGVRGEDAPPRPAPIRQAMPGPRSRQGPASRWTWRVTCPSRLTSAPAVCYKNTGKADAAGPSY
jgi:hypothetical protein